MPPTFPTPFFIIGGLQRSMDVENCENCKAKSCKEPESVTYIVHEASMARMERQAKRLWIAVLLLIVLLVGTNASWLYYESSFEDSVTTTYEADAEDGGNTVINGDGRVNINGES